MMKKCKATVARLDGHPLDVCHCQREAGHAGPHHCEHGFDWELTHWATSREYPCVSSFFALGYLYALALLLAACGDLAPAVDPPAPSSAPPPIEGADPNGNPAAARRGGGVEFDAGTVDDAGPPSHCAADGAVEGAVLPCFTSDTDHTHVQCCSGPHALCCASPRDASLD